MKRWSGLLVAAALCVAADVHAAPAASRPASAASKASSRPGKKALADAYAFLRNLLDPQELTPQDKARIKKLIALLAHDNWQTREKACEELSRFGPEALPLVHAAAGSKDPEVVMRVGLIVETIEARASDVGGELNPVIDVLTAGRDKSLVGMLIKLLDHASVGGRYASEYGLRRITGKSFGYSAYGEVGERAAAVEKWRKWWKESKAKFSFEKVASESKQFGLLICDGPSATVSAVTLEGKVLWSHKVGPAHGLGALANGGFIVGYTSGKNPVEEFDREFKVVWNANKVSNGGVGVYDVRRLANGNTLITYLSGGHVSEVTRKGQIVWQKKGLSYPISAQRLANGNTLIAEYNKNRVFKVNRAGAIIWQKTGLKNPCDVAALANGNVLIGLSDNRAIEVNRSGKIVWQQKCTGRAISVCRLPDGRTAIYVHGKGAILVDRGGKVIRQLLKRNTTWGRVRMAPVADLNRK